jgi:hypothetical protein
MTKIGGISVRAAITSASLCILLFSGFHQSNHYLKNINKDDASFNIRNVKARPYGEFCETAVFGEKQKWNPRKKIISYSLSAAPGAGGRPIESSSNVKDLQKSIQSASIYFPDWIIRVHVFGFSRDSLQLLLDLSSCIEIVQCSIKSSPLAKSNELKGLSRYLAYDDPTVYYTLIRNIQHRFTNQELLHINEWMISDFTIHSLRGSTAALKGESFLGIKRGSLRDNNIQKDATITSLISQALMMYSNRANEQPFLHMTCSSPEKNKLHPS